MIVQFAASFIPPFLLALLVLSILWPNNKSLDSYLLFKSSLAVGLGIGFSSCCFFLWLLIFGAADSSFVAMDPFLYILIAGYLSFILRQKGYVVRSEAMTEDAPSNGTDRFIHAWSIIAVAVAIVLFISFSLKSPHGGWDAWSIWNLRAKFLFRGGDHWTDGFSPGVKWSHPDYPLLIPATIARGWSFLGIESTLTPATVSLLFTLAVVGLLASSISMLRGSTQAALAVLVLLGTPTFISQGASQYADVPLGFFYLATLTLLVAHDNAQRSCPRLLFLAGAFSALAAWTKNEGLMFVVTVVLVRTIIVLHSRGWRAFVHQTRTFVAGLLPFIAVVVLFKMSIAPPSDLLGTQGFLHVILKLTDPSRYFTVLSAFLSKAYHFGGGYLNAVPFLSVLLLMSGIRLEERDRTGIATSFFVLLLMLMGYCLVYIVTPYDLQWHLDTSLDRLLMHLWPSLVFSFFLAVPFHDVHKVRKAAL